MMRMIVLPIAANVIYVLDGVLADLDRYLAVKLHEELRTIKEAAGVTEQEAVALRAEMDAVKKEQGR